MVTGTCYVWVMAIRHAYNHGAIQAALGEKYGIARPTVSAIVHYKTWKHLP